MGVDGVAEDVVLQSKPAKDEQDVTTPFGVIRGLQIKNNWDEILDVLHSGCLAMKMSNSRSLHGDEVAVTLRVVVVGMLGVEPRAEGRGLLLQQVGLLALQVQGGGSRADPLLGGGGRREEVRSLSWALRAWLESRREAASISRALAVASASSRSLAAAAAAEVPGPETSEEEGATMVDARRPEEGARWPSWPERGGLGGARGSGLGDGKRAEAEDTIRRIP